MLDDPYVDISGLPDGDLVVRVPAKLSPDLVERIRAQFAGMTGRQVYVFGDGLNVESLDALIRRAADALADHRSVATDHSDRALARAAVEAAFRVEAPDA